MSCFGWNGTMCGPITLQPGSIKPQLRCEGCLQFGIRRTLSGVLLEEHCKNDCWMCRRWLESGDQLSAATTVEGDGGSE